MWVGVFFLGSIWGSIVTIISEGFSKKAFLIYPTTICKSCILLKLVPILGYFLALSGCRKCQVKISFRYPLIQLISGVGLLLIYLTTCSVGEIFISVFFYSLLLLLSIIDIELGILPDPLNILGIITGLFFASMGWLKVSLFQSFLGAALGFALIGVIAVLSKGGMGMGDAKLLAMIGSYLGLWGSFQTLFLGSILGTSTILTLVLIGKWEKKDPFPFAPFLALGALIVWSWYKNAKAFLL